MIVLHNVNKLSDKKLRELLFTLNFNIYSDGTKYLIEAINLAYKEPCLLKTLKDIYSMISIKYSIPEDKVKWAIRNSIETMNRNTSNEEINNKLNITGYKKMTPKYFIPIIILYFKE